MKIPNVILFPDTAHSVCSFWRALGVYQELERQNKIKLTVGDWNNTWTSLRKFDVAIFQRPMTTAAAKQVFYCKDMRLRCILDFDDLNYIPKNHPVYEAYVEMYDEATFTKMMMLADIVQVSTEYLKNHYLKYNQNVIVVLNAINDYWLNIRKFKTSKQVILRLGSHHEEDVYAFKNEISYVMNNNLEWRLVTLGSDPIFLRNEIKNYRFVADFEIHDYFAYIMNSTTSVIIAPLIDNEFNRAKSNISWQEATVAGGCAMTPVFMPDTESMRYSNKEDFAEGLNMLLINETKRKELYEKSVELIKEKFLLSKVNKNRIEIINNL
jgi:hypothetical protein